MGGPILRPQGPTPGSEGVGTIYGFNSADRSYKVEVNGAQYTRVYSRNRQVYRNGQRVRIVFHRGSIELE